MNWESIQAWFFALGEQYGVDPVIFGTIYVGAIPFFTLSVAWIVRNLRRKRPIVIPVLSASFFFVAAYVYLIIVGRNIPVWVYAFLAVMVAYGVFVTVRKIRSEAGAAPVEPSMKSD